MRYEIEMLEDLHAKLTEAMRAEAAEPRYVWRAVQRIEGVLDAAQVRALAYRVFVRYATAGHTVRLVLANEHRPILIASTDPAGPEATL